MPAQARPFSWTFSSRLKIGLAFAALGLVAFALVGWLSGLHARQQTERGNGEALHELARNVSLNLDMGLFERLREIANLAELQSQVDRGLDDRAWSEVLETMRASLPEYSWIGVTDASGRVTAATGGLLEGQNVAARPWYTEGRRAPFVGDLHEALLLSRLLPPEPGGEPLRLLDFSAPLMRDGQVVGVIGAHLSWAWARARCKAALTSLGQLFDVDVAVFDAKGREILRPPNGVAPLALPTSVLDDIAGQRFAVRKWEDGRAYLIAAVRSQGYAAYKGLGWTIVLRQPLDKAFAPARSLERRIWFSGLAGALAFGVMGWLLAGRLTAPLRQVAAQAREVAAGSGLELDGGHERDEVRQLATSLGSLVAQLQAREADLRRVNDELEARVAERTASLSRANADLESFSRSVSHDLKGPIAAMGAMLRQIVATRQDRLETREQHLLSALAEECDRLRDLVDGMLNLAMVERQPMQAVPIDMPALARAVVADLRGAAAVQAEGTGGLSAAEVVTGPMPDTHPVGDPVLLRQVWQNLLSNAFKFSARVAHPRIEIGGQDDGTTLRYWVKDNGTGFDPARAASLFEAFHRLPEAKGYQGTGVGLSIVQKVIERHGGRVWCEAAPGLGARFSFSLPKSPADAAPPPGGAGDAVTPDGARAARRGSGPTAPVSPAA